MHTMRNIFFGIFYLVYIGFLVVLFLEEKPDHRGYKNPNTPTAPFVGIVEI